MANDDRKYVRVYYSVIDDPRFEHVYADDAALAAWLRMLLDADAMWPASASLPRGLTRRVLRVLCESGLIEVSADRFRIHGLDAERQRRAEAGRVGGLASGRSRAPGTVHERSSNGPSNERSTVGATKSNLDEHRRAETSTRGQARAGAREASTAAETDPEQSVVRWLAAHGAPLDPNGNGMHRRLIRLVDAHGADRVLATFAELGDLHEARQYVLGADNALNPIPSIGPAAPTDEQRAAAAVAAFRGGQP